MKKNSPQFSVWLVDLNPVKGSEQSGIRPCVLLQTNAVSYYGLTTLIAPFSSQKLDRIYPYEIKIAPSTENGLSALSKLKCDQIRVISKERLIKQIGYIEKQYHFEILKAVKIIFDLQGDFR